MSENRPPRNPSILRRIIRASSNSGGVVMDFFAGSGTTGAACLELGRTFCVYRGQIQRFAGCQPDLGRPQGRARYRLLPP